MSEPAPEMPEEIDRVLLLASYCGGDNPDCSDRIPCPDCLQMCNVAIVSKSAIDSQLVLGGLDYLKENPELDREAVRSQPQPGPITEEMQALFNASPDLDDDDGWREPQPPPDAARDPLKVYCACGNVAMWGEEIRGFMPECQPCAIARFEASKNAPVTAPEGAEPSLRICGKCLAPLAEQWTQCGMCGQRRTPPEPSGSPENLTDLQLERRKRITAENLLKGALRRAEAAEKHLKELMEIIDAHEIELLDCDRRGHLHCDCLHRKMKEIKAALAPTNEQKP